MKAFRRSTVLLALIALLVSACGGAPGPQGGAAPTAPAEAETRATSASTSAEATAALPVEATAAPAAGEKVHISFWFNPPEGGETADCFVETAVKPFNQQSSTVEVAAIEQPNAWDATRTALAGGGGPDVVVTPGPSFAFELAEAGQLLPLDDYVAEFGWDKTFVDWALNLGRVGGKLYSVPHELETLVLYYNKTLFEQQGWQPPKTMDELMTLAEKIQAAGIIPFGHANAEWRPANEWFVGEYLNHVAGPQLVYDALTGKRPWTDPEFVRAIDLLNTAQQKGWFMGGLDRYYTATFNEIHAALGNGDAAMNIEGTWFLNDIDNFFGQTANNQNEWDWVPVPSTSGDAIFDVGIGSTWSINKATKDPRAVAEFLTYVFSPEVQGQLLTTCSTAPAPVRLQANVLQGLDPRKAQIFEQLGQASDANNYGYTTWTFWPPKSDVYIYEQIEKVWAGEITPQQYLEGHQKLFEEELQAGDIPPIPPR
jgi:raffinose/stachyose/melibiose transport system substrate-binding protein